jgi:hypothetical protein
MLTDKGSDCPSDQHWILLALDFTGVTWFISFPEEKRQVADNQYAKPILRW